MNKDFRANLSQLKKRAFTLAETLIVMGIIGVVAALTLPNLNSSTGEKEKVAKLQKIYSNLQDAFGRAEAVYGPYDEWFVNDGNDSDKVNKRAFDRITEFMKYSKVCTVNDACTLFDAGTDTGGNRTRHAIILPDGATVGFEAGVWNNNCDIYIDLDGTNKGANTHCKDYFKLSYKPEQGGFYYTATIPYNNYRINKDSAGSCTAWILENGNMDYLKTNSSGECPNGTTLEFYKNTSCK